MIEIGFDELKKIQCEILLKVHTFCQEHGINYSLAYGTLLGAVRHKGYIPWDDDIDIMMLRPDYERFISTFSGAYPELSICSPELDLEYYAPYCNVWDNRTTLRESSDIDFLQNQHRGIEIGIKIDVFPIDSVSGNSNSVLFYKYKLLTALRWSSTRSLRFFIKSSTIPKYKKIVLCLLKPISTMIGYRNIQRLIIRLGKSCTSNNTDRVDMVVFDYKKRDFSKKAFDKCIDMPFEEYTFRAISDYDECLTASYGDYMALPPKEQQVPHHNFRAFWKDVKPE